MRVRNPKDFWAGVLFAAIGLAAVFLARDYPVGTTFKMGPGYFPIALGGLLALVGVASITRGLLQPGTEVGKFAWREIAIVLASTVVFGLLVRGAGLVAAVVALVLGSAYASTRFRWGTAALLAAGLAAFCTLLFVTALGMPLPVRGPWLGG